MCKTLYLTKKYTPRYFDVSDFGLRGAAPVKNAQRIFRPKKQCLRRSNHVGMYFEIRFFNLEITFWVWYKKALLLSE